MDKPEDPGQIERLIEGIKNANKERLKAEEEILYQDNINEGIITSLLHLRDKHQESGNAKTTALIDAVLMICDSNAQLRYSMWNKLSHLCSVQMDQMSLRENEKQHIYFEAKLDVVESKVYNKAKKRAFAPQRPYVSPASEDSRKRGSQSSVSPSTVVNSSIASIPHSQIATPTGDLKSSVATIFKPITPSSLSSTTSFPPPILSFASSPKTPYSPPFLSPPFQTPGSRGYPKAPPSTIVLKQSIETMKRQLPFDKFEDAGKRTLQRICATINKNNAILAEKTDQLIFTINLEDTQLLRKLTETESEVDLMDVYNVRVMQGKVLLHVQQFRQTSVTISILESRVNPRYPLEFQFWKPTAKNSSCTINNLGSLAIVVSPGDVESPKEEIKNPSTSCFSAQHAPTEDDVGAEEPREGLWEYLGSAQAFVSQLHVLAFTPDHLRLELYNMDDGNDTRRVLRDVMASSPQHKGWVAKLSRDGNPFHLRLATGETVWRVSDIKASTEVINSEAWGDATKQQYSQLSMGTKLAQEERSTLGKRDSGVLCRTIESEYLKVYTHRMLAFSTNGERRYAVIRDPPGQWWVLNAHGVPIRIVNAKARDHKITSRMKSMPERGSASFLSALEAAFHIHPPLPLARKAIVIDKVITRRRSEPETGRTTHNFGFDGEWEPQEAKRIREDLLKVPQDLQKPLSRKSRQLDSFPILLTGDALPGSVNQRERQIHDAKKETRIYQYDFPDGRENILFSLEKKTNNRTVRCATLDKLIERVTHPDYPPDNIRTVFLLMYHSFTTPRELLARLVSRYFMPTPMNVMPDEQRQMQAVKKIVQHRVVGLIMHWINAHYTDFQDDVVLKTNMRDFITLIKPNRYQQKLRTLEEGPRELLESKIEVEERVLSSSISKENWEFAATSNKEQDVETARQLSLMAFEEYKKIRMRDVLDKIFEGRECQHITTLVRFFNSMSKLVQETVVSESRVKQRAALMTKFVNIAWELKEQHNFLMSFAISSAVGSNPVYRLKRTKELLERRTVERIDILKHLYAKGASGSTYREALDRAVQSACVPYIGTTLKDLTFTHDGNKDHICGMINFYKRVLMSDSMQQFDQFQRKRYPFEPVTFIQDQLREDFLRMEGPDGSEGRLYEMSLEVEPREN